MEKMRAVYANLPGVEVKALRFASGDISGERLLAMMKVDENNRTHLSSCYECRFRAFKLLTVCAVDS